MLPESVFQIFTITTDLIIIIFVWYFLWDLHAKQKQLEKKENKLDSNYHHIVDDALSQERKILDDATHEADQIITGAHYVNHASQQAVDQALETMTHDIQKDAGTLSKEFMDGYSASLKHLADTSLNDFHQITKALEAELQKETDEFRKRLLPNLEKELEDYKRIRLQQAEQTINQVVQRASQEILNKTISLHDHQNLVLESLEKVKKQGGFD